MIKEKLHPSWFLPDLPDSDSYIDDEGWSQEQSPHSGNDSYRTRVRAASSYFKKKHGYVPEAIVDSHFPEVLRELKAIRIRFAVS